jgi:acetyltransferase
MALGALDSMGRGALERSYRDMVALLEERQRLRVGVATEARGRGIGQQLMSALEEAAREHGVTLLWLTTHAGTDACAFYEAEGYTPMGTMPNYSRRPDGTLWPGAFYFKELSA